MRGGGQLCPELAWETVPKACAQQSWMSGSRHGSRAGQDAAPHASSKGGISQQALSIAGKGWSQGHRGPVASMEHHLPQCMEFPAGLATFPFTSKVLNLTLGKTWGRAAWLGPAPTLLPLRRAR